MSDSQNAVSGQVAGAVVQAGSVHGGVHVHSAEPRSPVPRQLLPPPPGFTNRAHELSILDQTRGVVVLKGQGGVGKTALALRWLEGVAARFPDGQLYADLALSTGEPVAPEDVLGQFLRSLGLPPQRVPGGLAERTALYRSMTAGKSVAVLLDDAVSAAQVRVLLPGSNDGVTVVTSRRPLLGLLAAGARTVQVDPLDPDAALELLGYRIGHGRVAAERRPAEALAGFCGGLPIALCVAGARAAARPRRSLARMVDELADERARLDALSAEGDLSVRSTLDVAYADLPADLQRVYRALGLHPGTAFGIPVVAAMIETAPRTARTALDALVDASLAEELDEDYYRLHDLVRVHALDQALAYEGEEERTATVHRAVQWYLLAIRAANRIVMPARNSLSYQSTVDFAVPDELDSHSSALEWLERHRPTLLAAMRDAVNRDWPELAYHLADALQPLLILHKHHADTLVSGEIGLRAAQAAGDPRIEARLRKQLARAYAFQGQVDRAQRHTDELLAGARDRGDRRAEAAALKTLAFVLTQRGRLDQAADAFAETADILRALGKRRGEGLALINLGETLIRLGRSEHAIGHLWRARDLLAALGVPDPYNEARATAGLGNAHLERGDHAAARPLLEQALTVFADQGSDHERGHTHRSLAELARSTGDHEQAQRHDDLARTLLAAPDPTARGDHPPPHEVTSPHRPLGQTSGLPSTAGPLANPEA